MIVIAVVSTCWIAWNTFAGPDDDELMGRPTFAKNGQLFTVQFTPAAHRIDVKLTGTDVASVTPDEYIVGGKVYPRIGQQHELELERHEGHYHIHDQLAPEDQIEINVQNKKTKKSETFRFEGGPKAKAKSEKSK